MPAFRVAAAAWPGLYVGGQLYRPGETVTIDPSKYGSQLPRWGGTPGAAGYVAPKLQALDAQGAADLAAFAAVLPAGNPSVNTVTDAPQQTYPLGTG